MKTHISKKLLILAALICGAIAQTRPGTRSTPEDISSIRTGDYLRRDYIEKLNATHSSLKAETSGTAQLIQVSKESNGLQFSVIFNFHEGGYAFLVHGDGSFVELEGSSSSKPVLKVLTNRSFSLKFDAFPTETYRFVGDVNRYVATRMVVGKYRDQERRSYVFREDGWAIFPDRKFKYEIGTDHVLTHYDYFWDRGSDKFYAITKAAGKLNIFKTYGEMDESVDAKPILSLTVVSTRK
jgi:hypothetical protein